MNYANDWRELGSRFFLSQASDEIPALGSTLITVLCGPLQRAEVSHSWMLAPQKP